LEQQVGNKFITELSLRLIESGAQPYGQFKRNRDHRVVVFCRSRWFLL